MRPFLYTRSLSVTLSLGALLISGCAPGPRPQPPLPPAPPGMENVLLNRLQENARAFHALQGIARVRVEAGEKSVSGKQVLFVEEPARFRAEVLSPFGSPLLLAATEGSLLTVLVPGEGRFYSGEASYRNLQRFTRLPLQLEDLVHLILYKVPLLPGVEPTLSVGENGYLLTLAAAGGARQELLFDPGLRLVRASWYRDQNLLLRAEYGSFTEGETPFPKLISLRMPPQEVSAALDFSELEINPRIPAERFTLKAPEGYTTEPLP